VTPQSRNAPFNVAGEDLNIRQDECDSANRRILRARSATGRSTNSPLGRRRADPFASSKASVTSRAPLQFVCMRAEGGVNDRQLRRMDRGLAEEPQRTAVAGLAPKTFAVSQERVDAVDRRLESRCPRGDHQV
jgi:hypothetical protein